MTFGIDADSGGAVAVVCVDRPRVQLRQRDLELLDALVRRVKVLSLAQVSRTWWPTAHGTDAVRKRLHLLAGVGYVSRVRILAASEAPVSNALARWAPGERVPDFAKVIAIASVRWESATRSVSCVAATALAAARFAATFRTPRLSEGTHDLHVAQLYLRLLRASPWAAQRWEGEACRGTASHDGEKVPDAMLRLPGRPMAIEVVGQSYSTDKLRAFHEYCAARDLGYELW